MKTVNLNTWYRVVANISCPQLSAEVGPQRTFEPNGLRISVIPKVLSVFASPK